VIREARYHAGMDAPADEFMAQIETESRCDEGVTAFDGGAGLGQFMPATAAEMQEREESLHEFGDQAAPYDPRWAIRALILYNVRLLSGVSCREWHYAYRAYNGGLSRINREIKAARSCDRAAVDACCDRKKIRMKWGVLDMCVVNCTYPDKIKAAARKYRRYL
jgi:soluble lytic murein transglycosylase-like protein